MACVARAARGSFVTILQFLLIRNAAEELNKFHYNYAYFHFRVVEHFRVVQTYVRLQIRYTFRCAHPYIQNKKENLTKVFFFILIS